MYTTGWCGDCRAAKSALEARGIPFVEVDLDADPGAAARVESLNGGRRSVPTLVRGSAVASRVSGRRPATGRWATAATEAAW